ncbi:DUF4062 domain-containing protein [Sphingomonas sp.]|uniref:DUF4062 domain-containing protein n=1 Tax=Sphingomonas sp. TaxID=28214 RepID=UPI0028B0B0B9|nr:DUF4062 domain-containing protein [Sphingomonas sp.]
MKVFISSLISGFEPYRDAARRAVVALRNEAVMAEDFGAQPNSSQVACMQGLRSADVVVLILGPRYGFVPAGSTISATHQEYREARDSRPVLAFIQQGVDPEAAQKAFIDEVQAWEGGFFRESFRTAEDLHDGITRALHDHILAKAIAPVDQGQLISDASGMIPAERRNQSSTTFLALAIVGGPSQRILRPMQMEDPKLGEQLEQSALYGDNRLFDRTKGADVRLDGSDLVISQDRGTSIRLTEQGAMLFLLSLEDTASRDRMGGFGGMMIVEEVVRDRLTAALGYAAATVERIDATQRLSHVGVAAHISGGEYRAWRTRAQQEASGSSMQISMGQQERRPITLCIRRAALRLDRAPVIEDILVPLRRQFSQG